MSYNNYKGFYDLNPQSSKKLNDDLKRDKQQLIDKKMSENYENNFYFDRIKRGNNNKPNNINEEVIINEILNKKFDEDTQEAIRLSIKEDKERKLKENKMKEEIEKKKLNDENLNKNKNLFDNAPSKNENINKTQKEINLDNNFNDLNNKENLINKNQLNSTIENKIKNSIENSKQNENNENKINQNNNNSNINSEKENKQNNIQSNSEKENKQNNNLLTNNINNPKLNNANSKETMSNIKQINSQDLLNNSNNNEKDFDKENITNINIRKKYNQNLTDIMNSNNNEVQTKKKNIKIINDYNDNNNNLNQKSHSTRSKSISKKQPEPLIYVPLQNPPGHNSCYIHSTIHILFYCTDFSNYILQLNKNPIINNKLIRSLVKIFNDYLSKSKETTNLPEEYKYIYNSLDTFNFRYELSLYSKQRFKLYLMGDPVELIIYLLENCSEIDSNLIHKLFYIDIREKYFCSDDKIQDEIKYDKDNFVREIYIEELLNFLVISEMAFEDFKNKLFNIFKEVSYQHIKKCKKCKLVMQKITVCSILPKYLLINCVWSNKNPNYENIIQFFSMIPFNFNTDDMFDIKIKKCYSLFGIILYSYHLSHYINVIYDNKKDLFILYSDEFIIKIKKIEELYDYLTGKTKKDKIFYPVLLVYQENVIENKKKLEIDNKFYDYLMEKVIRNKKENIQQKDNILNNTINEKKDNSIQELDNKNLQKIKIENSNNEDSINNDESKISIVDHMMNKVNNLYYYNELDKKHQYEVQKSLEKQKKTNPNEDLNKYKDNLKMEKNNRSMTLDKKKNPNFDEYLNSQDNHLINRNQKKENLKANQNNLINKGRGANNNIKQNTVKPNIKKNNNETNFMNNKNYTFNLGGQVAQNDESKSKFNTMNSFNRGSRAKNQNYNGNNQRINYTKYKSGYQ